MPIPTKRKTLDLPVQLHDKFELAARAQGKSFMGLLKECMVEYLRPYTPRETRHIPDEERYAEFPVAERS